jgi:hypothetical protein
MSGEQVYNILLDLMGIEDSTEFPELGPLEKALFVNEHASRAVRRYMHILKSEDVNDDQEIVAALEKLYDRYVVPIKFSNRPMIEGFIEGQLRTQIPVFVAMIREYVQTKKAA